jgi:hypothetical protein
MESTYFHVCRLNISQGSLKCPRCCAFCIAKYVKRGNYNYGLYTIYTGSVNNFEVKLESPKVTSTKGTCIFFIKGPCFLFNF